jgi:O-acetyl-ADP-ribose deacetylase (regulator of RNase III)
LSNGNLGWETEDYKLVINNMLEEGELIENDGFIRNKDAEDLTKLFVEHEGEIGICGAKENVVDKLKHSKLEKIYLIDSKKDLGSKWVQVFSGYPEVEVIIGDYFQQSADAIVSPANSFGIMDGGLDLAIRNELGFQVEADIQEVILNKYHGEMPIGAAEVININHEKWSYLIVAPTMRIPENVAFTLNAYNAFRAILIAVNNFNESQPKNPIKSLVCSGLGTGIGGMDSTKCAGLMRAAYKLITEPARIASFAEIHKSHQTLLTI